MSNSITQAMATDGQMSPATAAIFRWTIPGITGVFGLFFPAGLQLTLLSTAVFTVTQAYLFRKPWFRQALGMYPQPKPRTPATTTINVTANIKEKTKATQEVKKPKWGLEAVKATFQEAYADIKKKQAEMGGVPQQSQEGKRRSTAEQKRAKAYEERVQKEMARTKLEYSKRKR